MDDDKDPVLSISDWLSQEIKILNAFVEDWANRSEADLKNWPASLPASSWDAEYQAFHSADPQDDLK